jgi:hypothetical protein
VVGRIVMLAPGHRDELATVQVGELDADIDHRRSSVQYVAIIVAVDRLPSLESPGMAPSPR